MARVTPLPVLQHHFRRLELDEFQAEAIYQLDCGNSVLLAAPTGTGKTLVADYLVTKVLQSGRQLAYTAPVKALVNQKYRSFARELGRDRIGIITGDVAQNPDAPVVVMTTEILRNELAMGANRRFDWVVFDEIHYLDHPKRGNVWEQALLLLSRSTRILGLSATVPNAEEIAAWIGRLLGTPVALIRHSIRAVPLCHYYYNRGTGLIAPGDLFVRQSEAVLGRDGSLDVKGGFRGAVDIFKAQPAAVRYREETTHLDLVSYLAQNRLFPCLYFVFSRRGCEEKARQLAARADYLNSRDKDAVRVAVRQSLAEAGLGPEDVPDYKAVKEMWLRGIGVHHAGMLPVLKEIVEVLLERRLLRVVYATETFAIGVNLPVRAVCFDSLHKFDGQNFRFLNQQEYFQMAGRAGRRGLDRSGTVIALADFAALQREPPPVWDEGSLAPIQSRFALPDHVILNLTARFDERDLDRFFGQTLAAFQGGDHAALRRAYLARQTVLRQLDYLDEKGLRPRGEVARRIYQRELAATELIFAGVLDELPPADLAGLAAALAEEERPSELAYAYQSPSWLGQAEAALSRAFEIAGAGERWLDPAVIPPVALWCTGADLAKVLRRYPQDPGDFVARCRRAIDLLRQIGTAAPNLRQRTMRAAALLDRDLVRLRL
ncbi:MAG: DEAD/DEAH box helicase [Bacteroidota bacterium]